MEMINLYYNINWDYEFIKLPKFLFEHDRFAEMSSNAKILYAGLLGRSSLSAKNGWKDKNNKVFIKYTLSDACSFLSCSLPTAIKVFRELEDLGLIEKVKGKKGGPDKIYVMVYID